MDCLPRRLGKCSNPARLLSTQSTNEGVSLGAALNSYQLSDLSTINARDDDLSFPLADRTLDSLNLPDYDPAEAPNFGGDRGKEITSAKRLVTAMMKW